MDKDERKHSLVTLTALFALLQICCTCKASSKAYTRWNNITLEPPDSNHTLVEISIFNYNNTITLPDETEVSQPVTNKCFLQAKNYDALSGISNWNPRAHSCDGFISLSITTWWPPVIFYEPSNLTTWNYTHIFYNSFTPKPKCNTSSMTTHQTPTLPFNSSTIVATVEAAPGSLSYGIIIVYVSLAAALSISMFFNIVLCQNRRKYIKRCRQNALTTKPSPMVKNENNAGPNNFSSLAMKPPVTVSRSTEPDNRQEHEARSSSSLAPPTERLEYARADVGSRVRSVDYLTPMRQDIPEYLDFNESRQQF